MRRAVVAGQFYEGEAKALRRRIEGYIATAEVEIFEEMTGAVVPHAGYVYSGQVAAHVYAALPSAETYVILGPNHRGAGSMVAVSTDTWSTPLGEVEIDEGIVNMLPDRIDRDEVAHRYEHSIEVQLPFLQYRFKDFKIVPICMGLQDEETAKKLGAELGNVLKDEDVVILASSDFTHYEPNQVARKNDHRIIKSILELDVSTFYSHIYSLQASVCGHGPIATMMETTRAMGAKKGALLKYATSGDVTGDYSSVVGYAGIVID
ncbi:MAG: MEMO1 family protein [Methanosarcinales archaeon Met12]|nr:MAG: MEMO1 family protein [Methanosarcinales archaeon Met12]